MYEPTLADYIAQLEDPNPDVRRNAAWVMGRARDVRIVAPLIQRLQNDADGSVRARAAESLGTRREDAAVAALISALQNDAESDVRRMAARSLGYVAAADAAKISAALIAALQDHADDVRSQTAEALMHVAMAETDTPLDLSAAVMPLINAFIDDANASVRHFAADALVAINTAVVHQALITAIAQQQAAAVLTDMLELMGKMGDKVFAATLAAYVGDERAAVAAAAQWAQSRIGRGE